MQRAIRIQVKTGSDQGQRVDERRRWKRVASKERTGSGRRGCYHPRMLGREMSKSDTRQKNIPLPVPIELHNLPIPSLTIANHLTCNVHSIADLPEHCASFP